MKIGLSILFVVLSVNLFSQQRASIQPIPTNLYKIGGYFPATTRQAAGIYWFDSAYVRHVELNDLNGYIPCNGMTLDTIEFYNRLSSSLSGGSTDSTVFAKLWKLGLYTPLTDSRLTNSRSASDVYSWAKASVKPSYTASEVGLSNVTNNAQWYSGNHPTTTTDYGLPSYPTTLPASDVYSWAKAATKPTYTYSEVGAQAPIANLSDTSKYFESMDSAGTNGWYRRAMEDAKFNAKQNTIANLADTSKYLEQLDSSGVNGWYRRAMSDAQLAAKAPLASPALITPNIGVATGTSLAVTGAITSSGAGIGYVTGAGGTVTQASSRTTGVTLSKLSGTITMFSAAVAAAASSTFTWTNTLITATDMVIMQHNSSTNACSWKCEVICGAGTATVVVKNISAASITEATPLKFIVIKASSN